MKSQLQQISDGLGTGALMIGATSIATTLVSTVANLSGMANLTPVQKTNVPYLNWKTIATGACGVLTKIPMIPNPAVGISRIVCKFLPIALVYFSA